MREAGAAPEGMVPVAVANIFDLYHDHGQVGADTLRFIYQTQAKVRDCLMRLIGATPSELSVKPAGPTVGYFARLGNPHAPNTRGYLAHTDDHEIATVMQDLCQAICDLMADSYRRGERRGQMFIRDLAEGKLTPKDLERL